MTPEQQRIAIAIAIAIAEACGWRCIKPNPFSPNPPLCGFNDSQSKTEAANGGSPWGIPNYPGDLNAMHAALQSQTQAFRAEFDRLMHALADRKHLLVTELEAKDWAYCFISCLQSQRDSGN
jgi:hypothetical protein